MCYTDFINTNAKFSVDELVEILLKRGGHIDSYYLREWNKSKTTLVHLKGWFSGKNVREAITKALA